MEEAKDVLECFLQMTDEKYVVSIFDKEQPFPFCVASREILTGFSKDVMGQGRGNIRNLNQRNAKGRSRLFAHPTGHRAGSKGRGTGICGRVPIFL